MKVKMPASALTKVEIDFLSLVGRGANRSPFKIIKAEKEPSALVASVKKFFLIEEPNPAVVGVFVAKSGLERALPNLAVAGFDITNYEDDGDMVVFKQAGWDACKTVIMLKSETDVGFAISNVGQHADTFAGSLLFDESVAKTGFYPGMNASLAALQLKLGAVMKTEPKDPAAQVDVEMKSFTNYVSTISQALPASIWKFESLQRGFGSDTTVVSDGGIAVDVAKIVKEAGELAQKLLKASKPAGAQAQAKEQTDSTAQSMSVSGSASSTTTTSSSEETGTKDDSPDDEKQRMAKAAATSTTEEDKMSKTAEAEKTVVKGIRPIVFKNADGTEYNQAIAPNGLVIKYTPGAKIPDGHTTMTEQWDQEGALGGTNNENGQGKGKAAASESADNELNHTGAGGLKKEELDALLTLPGLMQGLAQAIQKQGEQLTDVAGRLVTVEKTAKDAVKKVDGSVFHVGANADAALESLGAARRPRPMQRTPQQIAKAEYPEDLWGGTSLEALDRHAPVVDDKIPGVESV